MSANNYRLSLIAAYKNAVSQKSPLWINKLISSGNAITPDLINFEAVPEEKESMPAKLKNLFIKPIGKRKLYVKKYSFNKILVIN